LDDIDRSLIRHLQEDGRRPYTEIAQSLGISEATVRNRVNKLIADRALRIVGIADPYRLGFNSPAIIGVILDPGQTEKAAQEISGFEEVSYLVRSAGSFDLLVEVFCRDQDHLIALLEKLQAVPGMRRTETFIILKTYKLSYLWQSAS